VVTPGSATELADAVVRLAEAPREELASLAGRARRYYVQNFSEEVNAARLLDLLAAASEAGRR
jgi:glycosyltransferase involved in cell wall biosynthesis